MLKRPLAAAALAVCCATGGHAAAATVTLDTDLAGWNVRFWNLAGHNEFGLAQHFDCVPGGPGCIGLTSNSYANGAWVNGVPPSAFGGPWYAFLDFTLPTGATNVRIDWQFFGVDDTAVLWEIAPDRRHEQLAAVDRNLATPSGFELLTGSNAAPGLHRLELQMLNQPNPAVGFQPLSDVDGSSVSLRATLSYDLQRQPVPAPPTQWLAGLALAAAWRRRRPARPVAG